MQNNKGQVGMVIAIIIGSLVALFMLAAIGSALNLITIPWLKFNSQVQMNRDVVTKTYNADNAIYNYHWFQETYGDIQAMKAQIAVASATLGSFESQAGARATWGFEDKQEDARLKSVLLGIQLQYESVVQNYNAKAGEADRSMFVNGLPLFVNL